MDSPMRLQAAFALGGLGSHNSFCSRTNVEVPRRSKTHENPTARREQLSSETVLSYIAHYTSLHDMMSNDVLEHEAYRGHCKGLKSRLLVSSDSYTHWLYQVLALVCSSDSSVDETCDIP